MRCAIRRLARSQDYINSTTTAWRLVGHQAQRGHDCTCNLSRVMLVSRETLPLTTWIRQRFEALISPVQKRTLGSHDTRVALTTSGRQRRNFKEPVIDATEECYPKGGHPRYESSYNELLNQGTLWPRTPHMASLRSERHRRKGFPRMLQKCLYSVRPTAALQSILHSSGVSSAKPKAGDLLHRFLRDTYLTER